ncbi:MAG TPA: UDP-N-acetylmuramoyl-tripeptide--D-alanyl-D-alanine ligase [Dehalococcoidia bacterium]|nr:UDP-N-acetylmuramoyl-tripeptide--D-alanyl-D-alanine ligase [Dehalococcoidia bacterium]
MLAVESVVQGTAELLVAGRGPAGRSFSRAVIDSRRVERGDLFFALRGERRDGHDFIGEALERGAAGLVVERPLDAPGDVAVFQVSDALSALQRLAAFWRARHDTRVVGVTGSVGKTTAKELIAAVLGARYRVLKSPANLNTEIGLPLTLLHLTEEHERAVLEMAMYGPGEIDLLCRIARPDIGVVTNVGPVHLERLGSMGAIAAAKAELVQALPPDGLAILNGDDPPVAAMAARTKARALLYGQSPQCDVRADELRGRGLDGISFRLSHGGESVAVETPLPGLHHAYPALAAAAAGLSEGMTLRDVADALRQARPELRLRVRPASGGATILDDSYNASPQSMLAALDLLAELPGRRIAVLGEMRELGAAEEEGHRRVGERAAACADLVLVVGERARPLYEAAATAGSEARFFNAPEDALPVLRDELKPGDHVLIKASRAVALETLVEALVSP